MVRLVCERCRKSDKLTACPFCRPCSFWRGGYQETWQHRCLAATVLSQFWIKVRCSTVNIHLNIFNENRWTSCKVLFGVTSMLTVIGWALSWNNYEPSGIAKMCLIQDPRTTLLAMLATASVLARYRVSGSNSQMIPLQPRLARAFPRADCDL